MRSWMVLAVLLCGCSGASQKSTAAGDFQKDFSVSPASWSSAGHNDYFNLEPGHQDIYRGSDGELIITVMKETKTVDGVETRIVEERESAGGHLAEVSRNYYAIDKSTGDIYYFGEDVDEYKNDQVAGHPGGWLSGVNGAHYGMFMPGKPMVGMKFYQEFAPRQAMDRCEVVSMNEKREVPLGSFDNCLKIKETTPLESDTEYKVYAPKIGLLQDEDLKLVKQTLQ